MSSLLRKYWFLTVISLLFFASASLAQTTLTLTGVGDGATVGNIYVDPYQGTIGTSSTPASVICDDWADNSYPNTTWNVNVEKIAPTLTGSPLFGNNQALYNEAAFLSSLLLATATNTTKQAEISFALWQLTYSSYPYKSAESTTPFAYLASNSSSAIYNGAQTYLCEATGGCQGYAGEASYNASGWEILTPTPGGTGESQEFLVYTPESSATILFGADMLGLLGLAIVFRRRLLRPIL